MSPHSVRPRSRARAALPSPRLGRGVARFNRAVTNRITVHVAGVLPGMGIVIHVGRRTRTVYRTPVNVFRTVDGFRIALTYGRDAEWVKNAFAHGAVRLDHAAPGVRAHRGPRSWSTRISGTCRSWCAPSCASCGSRSSWTSTRVRPEPAADQGVPVTAPER